jgi:outer membrane protein assembly factor BamD (BamD/ComL family)
VLRQAREDLRAGLAESAYRRLADYDRQHGHGVLGQERQALAVIALCKWRPGSEAQARAAEFLRNTPESPLADRVRSECEISAEAAR